MRQWAPVSHDLGQAGPADQLHDQPDGARLLDHVVDRHDARVVQPGRGVGLAQRPPGVPLICMETALPAKFAATIREALGQEPARPRGFEGLEKLPQRYELIDRDAAAVKRAIESHGLR